MGKIAFILILVGSGMLFIGVRTTNEQMRKIGLGLVVGGCLMIGLSRLNVQITPN